MGHDDKTEAPTPKRKRDARKKGQIPKSAELVTWAQVLAASFVLPLTVQRGAGAVTDVLVQVQGAIAQPDPQQASGLLGRAVTAGLVAVLPLAGAMTLVGIVGHVAQTSGFASLSMLAPKAERLNPVQGLKRLCSPQSLWQAAKSALKVAVLVLVSWPPLRELTETLVASGQLELGSVAMALAETALRITRTVAMVGLGIAALDYGLQRRKVMKGMRMTKQEVKEEHRQSEGDPHVRAQLRQRQLSMGRNRMISAVKDADVVIVNPTHVAVALAYDGQRGAPRVVAKGRGAVAQRIREEADAHRVPMVRDVALARTIESTVRLGAEIPTELYEAVARVLAFLARLPGRRAFGGVLSMPSAAIAQVGR